MSRKTSTPARSREAQEQLPDRLELRCQPGRITLEALAVEGEAEVIPRFTMVAYTGEPLRVEGWRFPVVVDLEGLSIPSQRRPVRFGHSMYAGVGHTERIAVEAGRLIAEGIVSRDTGAAREVVASGKRGFPWQASIGAQVAQAEFVRAGKSVTVNSRTFEGPLYVARRTVLGEISFVDLGADGNTTATIAAQQQESELMDETKDTEVLETEAQDAPQDAARDEATGAGTEAGPAASATPAPVVNPVADNRWYFCELAVLSDRYIWRMDGQVVAQGSASPGGSMNVAYLGKLYNLVSQGYTIDADDIYTADDLTFLGPTTRVARLNPNRDGPDTGWAPSSETSTLWSYVSQIPQDGDGTYLSGGSPGAAFTVGWPDIMLAIGERVVAAAAGLCWRNTATGNGRALLRVGAAEQATANFTPGTSYDTVFVFARNSPATGKPWTRSEVSAALVGAAINTTGGLRATQAGLSLLLHTPPVVPIRPKEQPMNFRALDSLTATGSDQAVEVPRGATLVIHPVAANVEVRDVNGAAARLTIPADSMVMLGPSYDQTVYLRAAAGTVIELGLT